MSVGPDQRGSGLVWTCSQVQLVSGRPGASSQRRERRASLSLNCHWVHVPSALIRGVVDTLSTLSREGDRYPVPVAAAAAAAAAEDWSVERHLGHKPTHVVDLYERFVMLVAACGPCTVSVTKTAIAFRGTRRGFAGAKPRDSSLDGFLDLQREVRDERFLRISQYTKKLFAHRQPWKSG